MKYLIILLMVGCSASAYNSEFPDDQRVCMEDLKSHCSEADFNSLYANKDNIKNVKSPECSKAFWQDFSCY